MEHWILARLRQHQFASVFAQIDASAPMALPVQPWEWALFKRVRVHIDSQSNLKPTATACPRPWWAWR